MQYSEGKLGRVFVVRVDNGEDLLSVIRSFVEEKGIRSGIIHFLGALREGQLVTGPEEVVLPPVPHFVSFSGGYEIVGLATISPGSHGSHIHYHCSAGRGEKVLTGCLRNVATTYIIVEAIILEICGLDTGRKLDGVTGLELPTHGMGPAS
ncbi:MAG: DNA-binding protein [Methanoregulaceae archaeon]|nr:DNA-binding protein [Methanoregulaceae archaeon]